MEINWISSSNELHFNEIKVCILHLIRDKFFKQSFSQRTTILLMENLGKYHRLFCFEF